MRAETADTAATWYGLVDAATGALLAGPAPTLAALPTPGAGEAVRPVAAPGPAASPEPPAPGAPAAPAAPATLTHKAFRERFTLAEQVALELALDGLAADGVTPIPATTRATVRALRSALAEVRAVDPADPLTIGGVEALAALGLIDPARVDALLAPVPMPTPTAS